ncbi:VOC family protein [soil metagenome]
MARRIDLTFDCADAPRLAAFWKLALGYEDEPPPAPFATRDEWVASFGEDADADGLDGAWLHDPEGVGPRLALLEVPEPKVAKNRLHLDIRIPVPATEAEREATLATVVDELVAAGATVTRRVDGHHTVMADPEGNEFCVAFAKAG